MEKFLGVKIIQAEPMTRGDYNKFKGWTIPADENPADEGYIVKYSDDYISWSPKEAFEEAYRRIDNLTFGLAVEALKKGYRVCRKGWNGKGMWLRYINLYSDKEFRVVESEQSQGTFLPFLAIKTPSNELVPWVTSQMDVLAEDWMIIE